jgi:tripeptidyl-peptidase-1
MLLPVSLIFARVAPSPVAANETISFTLALTRQRPHALATAVAEVSDPESPRFRQYLSDQQLSELLEPTGLVTVESWLTDGMPSAALTRRAHGSGQVIDVSARAEEVSSLLGTRLARFGRLVRAATPDAPPPPLPPHVAPHVSAVLGVYELPTPAATRPSRVRVGTSCDFKGDIIDPNVLAKQYDWPAARAGTGRVSQGVAAFEDAQFNPSDVAAFEAAYSLPNVSFSVHGPNDGGYFGEAGLDTQYIAASGAGIPSWFLSQQAFDLATWCEASLSVRPLPSVWSISWGGGESQYPLAAQRAADDCFARAALKGVTVLAASGDDGTGSQGGLFHRCQAFDPTYPASCPHVTAVGASRSTSDRTHACACACA